MTPRARASGPPEFLALSSLLLLVGLLLYTVGRPIFTDDLWWHLALGRAYLAQGPWLTSDPLLFAAPDAPAPAAWLFDALVAGILELADLNALRVFHVLVVGALIFGVWKAARLAGASRSLAALAGSAFVVIAAYRIFQLRPELATIGATLCLHALLFSSSSGPGPRQIALAGLLSALWVNLHAGFLLAPILICAGLLGVLTTLPLQERSRRPAQLQRARRLALALGVVVVATLFNPEGPGAHLAYFAAGDTTPDLSIVSDEWSPLRLFAPPLVNAPPTAALWATVWVLLLTTLGLGIRALFTWRRNDESSTWIDPVLLALSAAGLIAMLIAVRFSWLGLFPLLLIAHATRNTPQRALAAWGAAAGALLLVPSYVYLGDWPFLSRGVPHDLEGYSQPFPANKYYANAAWFLQDTGIEGKLFTHYFQGGFYGLWLSPRVQPFINGSLNVPPAAVADYMTIQIRSGIESRSGMLERLDANGIDLFLGVGLPSAQRPNRPWRYTTAHLEGAPGWRLILRSLQFAVYLRLGPQYEESLERVDRYYASVGVPFDPEVGFEIEAVLDAAPEWAIAQGLVPSIYLDLRADTTKRLTVLNKLANLHATLGLYHRAVEIDLKLVRHQNAPRETARRLVWCLLHLGRDAEAREAARRLGRDPLSAHMAAAVKKITEEQDPEVRALQLAFLPAFTHAESGRIASGRARTPTRPFHAP